MQVNYLSNIEIILGLGKGFDGDGYRGDAMNEFKFDDTVNKNGGFIRYPFGYEGYITIHFTSKNVDSRTDGKYEFQINFIDNNKDLSS